MLRFVLLGLSLGMSCPIWADGLKPVGLWPLFRADTGNRGQVDRIFRPDPEQRTWAYQTGKGIFSTAVIDEGGSIYVGSADTWFYALSADGNLQWRYKTGEIIDSSAALSQDGSTRFVTVPSGDGYLHQLQLPESGGQPTEIWRFNAADHPHPQGKGYNWFEGNVAIGPDGNIYAGNTNWNFYAVNADGQLRWSFPAGNMNWSAAAFDNQGHLYIASLDFTFRKLRMSDGKVVWEKKSLGFNSGSLVLTDNVVLASSFDHKVYALDSTTGRVVWTFASDDHIYSSVAVSGEGAAQRIYVTSTDGRLYALNSKGQSVWAFDSRDVIRSSPVVNKTSDGQDVIYFGGGDGRLYAVNADGSLRWAFDTNVANAELADRNDLNASPALSDKSIIIGGEHGLIWSVPYDYPLLHPEDPRSILALEKTAAGVNTHLLTPGSRIVPRDETVPVLPSSIITLRLEHHDQDQRQSGGMNAWFGHTKIRLDPPVPFDWQISAAADTIFLKPRGFWQAGQTYKVEIDSQWMSRGLKIGALEIGGSKFHNFANQLTVNVAELLEDDLPWQEPSASADIFEVRRLSVNQPSMMPSLNQIGFDSYHWLVSLVEKREGRLLAWVRGAQLNAEGQVVPSPLREFRFPMTGSYQGDSYILTADNVALDLGGIRVKLKTLEFRGQLSVDQSSSPMASLYAEPAASSDWTYVPAIAALGLLNKDLRLPMGGTFLTRDYPSAPKPQKLDLLKICVNAPSLFQAGKITAWLRGSSGNDFDFLVSNHERSFTLSFTEGPTVQHSGHEIWTVEQVIPRATSWPKDADVRLMAGLYPLGAPQVPCEGGS